MKQHALPLAFALALSGCSMLPFGQAAPAASITGPSAEQPAAASLPQSGVSALGAQSVRADVLDTTTAEEKAAALASPAKGGEQQLGKVVVALGPPAEQGLWLKTALVTEAVQGRIETADGKSLALELRPGTGGALMSLGAYQALGLSLTALPEVTVYRQ